MVTGRWWLMKGKEIILSDVTLTLQKKKTTKTTKKHQTRTEKLIFYLKLSIQSYISTYISIRTVNFNHLWLYKIVSDIWKREKSLSFYNVYLTFRDTM